MSKLAPGLRKRPPGPCSVTRGIPLDFDITPQKTLEKAEDIKKFGPFRFTTLDAQTAIILLSSTEKNVLIEALQSLQKFCKKCEDNREIFVGLKGVPAVFNLINAPNRVTQRLALKLLAMTSYFNDSKVFIRDHDGAQALMNIGLYSEDDVVVEYATAILADLATNVTCRILMIKFNAFEALVDMAWKDDPDIQHNALVAVRNLLEETFHAEILLEQTSLRRILELIESKHDEVKLYALSIVDKVSRIPEGFELLSNSSVIYTTGKKLKKRQNDDINRVVLRIFYNLSLDTDCCSQMLTYFPQLTYFLDYASDPKVLSRTVKVVGNMCREPGIAEMFVDNGFAEKVSHFVSNKSLEVSEAAIEALIHLASVEPRFKDLLIRQMIPMMHLLHSKEISPHCVDNILYCFNLILDPVQYFSNASQDASTMHTFIAKGGIKLLRKIVAEQQTKKYPDNTIITALTCMNRLIHLPEITQQVAQDGLLQGLMICMNSKNPALFEAACGTTSILMSDETARSQFMHYKHWRYIINALKWVEHNALLALVPLLDILASYEYVAVQLIDHGIIKAISERYDFTDVDCPFHTILEQLVQFHLPAKYAITGRLDYFDVLSNGFYESGRLSPHEVFIPLRDLMYGVEPERKVIYLNSDHFVEEKVLARNKTIQNIPRTEDLTQLQLYIEELQRQVDEGPVMSEMQLVRLIGKFVSNKLGGPIDKWRIDSVVENTTLRSLQKEFESIAIPLTMFTEGTHRTRALLFKALADNLGIPATLERGEARTWNTVLLRTTKRRLYQLPPGQRRSTRPVCRQPCIITPDPETGEEEEEEEEGPEEIKEETTKEEPIDPKKVSFPVKGAKEKEVKPKKGGAGKKRPGKTGSAFPLDSEPSKSVGFTDGDDSKVSGKKGKNSKDKGAPGHHDKKGDKSPKKDVDDRLSDKKSKKSEPKSKKGQLDQKSDGKLKNARGKKASTKPNDSDGENRKAEDPKNGGKASGSSEQSLADEPVSKGSSKRDFRERSKADIGLRSGRKPRSPRSGRKNKKGQGLKDSKKAKKEKPLKKILKNVCKSDSTGSIDTVLMFDNDPRLPDCILGENVDLVYHTDPLPLSLAELKEEDGNEDEELDITEGVEQLDDYLEFEGEEEGEFEMDPKIASAPAIEPLQLPNDLLQFQPYVVLEERNGQKYWYSEKLRPFVVDLLFEPGQVFELNSRDADIYIGHTT